MAATTLKGRPRNENPREATSVRIDRQTSFVLADLAKARGEDRGEVVAKALEKMRREMLLENLNSGFAQLKANPKAWEEELAERRLWDSALSDGTENE